MPRRPDLTVTRAGVVTALVALAVGVSGAPAANLPESGTLQLPEGADVTLSGESGSRAGAVVTRAGDVNGDQKPDFLVGAPGTGARGRAASGSVFIVFGPREGLPEDLTK